MRQVARTFSPSKACTFTNATPNARAAVACALSRKTRQVFGSDGGLIQQHVERRHIGVPFREAGHRPKPLQSVPIKAPHIWPHAAAVVIDGDDDVVRLGITDQLDFTDDVLRQGIEEAGHVHHVVGTGQ